VKPTAQSSVTTSNAPASWRAWVLLAMTSCAACSDPGAGQELERHSPQTLHLSIEGEPGTLDPHTFNLAVEFQVLANAYRPLVELDAGANIVPGAAAHWKTSEDGLQWTFDLREGMTWSDGVPVTAANFVAGFRRTLSPATPAPYAENLYPLKNAEAVKAGKQPTETLGAYVDPANPLRLIIELDDPNPYLLSYLYTPPAFPLPEHVASAHPGTWFRAEHWVSNGAYVLHEWVPKSHITLVANPRYPDVPAMAEVVMHPIDDEQTEYNRFRSGELHAITLGNAPKLSETEQQILRSTPQIGISYVAFNTDAAPFDRLEMRRALSLVIDQRLIIDDIVRMGHLPAFSLIPDSLSAHDPVPLPHLNTPMEERRRIARRLLRDNGYDAGNPLELTLRYIGSLTNKKMAVAIMGMWQELGIDVRLQQSELAVHYRDLGAGDFTVALAAFSQADVPERFIDAYASDDPNLNLGRYRNEEFDRLLTAAQQQIDIPARVALVNRAEGILMHDYAAIPLYTPVRRRLVDRRLQGWEDNLYDAHPLRYLHWAD